MKVLFVSSCGSDGKPKNIVRNQGESLTEQNINMKYFCVSGRGIHGYFSSIPRLRKEIRDFKPDIIHAHYSLSGFLVWLTGARPMVVSLMGSDANLNGLMSAVTRFFSRHLWTVTIVKTHEMKKKLKLAGAIIISNGVNLKKFTPQDREESYKKTGLDKNKKSILFPADPTRKEKNYTLARNAIALLEREDVILKPLHNIPNTEMSYWYSSGDLLLLTSLWEGSPNAVKEAMACGLPVVSTDVGDVKDLIYGVQGCFICSYDPHDVAEKISLALEHGERTNGREKILKMGLDSASVAGMIITLYNKINGNQLSETC
jgi:teichuronic acid biosynthesis glycosyltransferase TuaC